MNQIHKERILNKKSRQKEHSSLNLGMLGRKKKHEHMTMNLSTHENSLIASNTASPCHVSSVHRSSKMRNRDLIFRPTSATQISE